MPCSSQEKPTTVAPLATQLIPPPVQAAVPESELETEVEDVGREEPTTMAGPTWDDSKQLSAAEPWPPSDVATDVAQAQAPPIVTLESHPEARNWLQNQLSLLETPPKSPYLPLPLWPLLLRHHRTNLK
jgi:hypothetical protein